MNWPNAKSLVLSFNNEAYVSRIEMESLLRGRGQLQVLEVALIGIRGDGGTSHHQSRDEGAQEGFAAAPGVVDELEEAEIQRQLLL